MKKWHIALSLSFFLYYLFGDVFISFGLKSLNYAFISAILSLCIGCLFYFKIISTFIKIYINTSLEFKIYSNPEIIVKINGINNRILFAV